MIAEKSTPVAGSDLDWWAYQAKPHRPKFDARAVEIDPSAEAMRAKLVRADIRYVSTLLKKLAELRCSEESDEYGALQTTELAYEIACRILIETSILAASQGRRIPRGAVSSDSEGGVRIQWIRENKTVHLGVPGQSEEDSYVYHEVNRDYGVEPATPSTLAEWLVGID
jgi:hypothetical protein